MPSNSITACSDKVFPEVSSNSPSNSMLCMLAVLNIALWFP